MHLQNRVETFKDIIFSSECTDHNHAPLEIEVAMNLAHQWLDETIKFMSTVYIVGNGGSAAVASHAQIDFMNVAKIRAQVLHEPAVLTCMSNDYGYETAYRNLLQIMLRPHDILVAISSSGQSKNIIYAAALAKERNAKVITFSGFQETNPLRKLGHLNYWLNSNDYGFVEIGHQFILHNLSDRFANIEEKSVSNV